MLLYKAVQLLMLSIFYKCRYKDFDGNVGLGNESRSVHRHIPKLVEPTQKDTCSMFAISSARAP